MYTRESQQSLSENATDRDNERIGFLVHEMRNLVNTAVVAFEVLKSGNVGVGGSTGLYSIERSWDCEISSPSR
jgi:hypothetical protein